MGTRGSPSSPRSDGYSRRAYFSKSGLQDMATTIEAEDEFDLARLPKVLAPTLLVGGGRDRFYDRELFEPTARLIPGCVLEMHPEGGHITVLSDPHVVAQILGFLSHEKN
jgi:pimeloyl-ACP methyl ester carboxylesterase